MLIRLVLVLLMLNLGALQTSCPHRATMLLNGSQLCNHLRIRQPSLPAAHLHRHSTPRSCPLRPHARLHKWVVLIFVLTFDMLCSDFLSCILNFVLILHLSFLTFALIEGLCISTYFIYVFECFDVFHLRVLML